MNYSLIEILFCFDCVLVFVLTTVKELSLSKQV